MKILDLVLKGKWYDMFAAEEKLDEYRDLTPYWFRRLLIYDPESYVNGDPMQTYFFRHDTSLSIADGIRWDLEMSGILRFKDFTHVRFHRGYTSTTMLFEIESMSIGQGREEWGAEKGKEYFVIRRKKNP